MTTFVKSTVRPAAVGEVPLVEHLQEGLEHVAVRLLDLVEQEHLVRALADRLGELPAAVVADVARRRADEARDGVRLGVLGEVEAGHRVRRVKQALGDRLGRLGLADAGRAEQEKRPDRPPRLRKPLALRRRTRAMRPSASRCPTMRAPMSSSRRSIRAPSVSRSRSTGTPQRLAHDLGDLLASELALASPPRARAREVEHADGLVGQRAVRHVSRAPDDGRGDRVGR